MIDKPRLAAVCRMDAKNPPVVEKTQFLKHVLDAVLRLPTTGRAAVIPRWTLDCPNSYITPATLGPIDKATKALVEILQDVRTDQNLVPMNLVEALTRAECSKSASAWVIYWCHQAGLMFVNAVASKHEVINERESLTENIFDGIVRREDGTPVHDPNEPFLAAGPIPYPWLHCTLAVDQDAMKSVHTVQAKLDADSKRSIADFFRLTGSIRDIPIDPPDPADQEYEPEWLSASSFSPNTILHYCELWQEEALMRANDTPQMDDSRWLSLTETIRVLAKRDGLDVLQILAFEKTCPCFGVPWSEDSLEKFGDANIIIEALADTAKVAISARVCGIKHPSSNASPTHQEQQPIEMSAWSRAQQEEERRRAAASTANFESERRRPLIEAWDRIHDSRSAVGWEMDYASRVKEFSKRVLAANLAPSVEMMVSNAQSEEEQAGWQLVRQALTADRDQIAQLISAGPRLFAWWRIFNHDLPRESFDGFRAQQVSDKAPILLNPSETASSPSTTVAPPSHPDGPEEPNFLWKDGKRHPIGSKANQAWKLLSSFWHLEVGAELHVDELTAPGANPVWQSTPDESQITSALNRFRSMVSLKYHLGWKLEKDGRLIRKVPA